MDVQISVRNTGFNYTGVFTAGLLREPLSGRGLFLNPFMQQRDYRLADRSQLLFLSWGHLPTFKNGKILLDKNLSQTPHENWKMWTYRVLLELLHGLIRWSSAVPLLATQLTVTSPHFFHFCYFLSDLCSTGFPTCLMGPSFHRADPRNVANLSALIS